MSTNTFKKLPSVLAFQRSMLVSDATLFSVFEDGSVEPLSVVRHGLRGTQNVNETESKASSAKASSARNVANVQITESARLDPEAVVMRAVFSIKMLNLDNALFSCAGGDSDLSSKFKTSLTDFISKVKSSEGLDAVCLRFARNIANGKWLWRNRTLAESIEIRVFSSKGAIATFNALDIPLNKFDNYSEGEKSLAAALVNGIKGNSLEGISVEADVNFGVKGAIEVYPSQNYIDKSGAKGFARSLYKLGHPAEKEAMEGMRVMGHAALRDQKVANAIRSIDTWYPEFPNVLKAIPVEPNGASLDEMQFFRKGDTSSFSMFKRLSAINPDSDEGQFCIAALIRGGVYSESEDKPKDSKTKSSSDDDTGE